VSAADDVVARVQRWADEYAHAVQSASDAELEQMVRDFLASGVLLPAGDVVAKADVRALAVDYERDHHAGAPGAWNTAVLLHNLAARTPPLVRPR
jgi:hypothetical protein